jgi:hypothetical protein
MNQKNGSGPDCLGGLDGLLPAEVLKMINELLEQLHKKDFPKHGNIVLNIYEKGSLHVDHVDNQNFYSDAYLKPKKTSKKDETPAIMHFDSGTPLSALFRANFYGELRTVIESWRPYLVNDDPSIDTLTMARFEFDKDHIYSNKVYRDLCGLDVAGALKVPLSQLAHYLTDHSNLSRSYATLYQQLKYYRSEYITYSP